MKLVSLWLMLIIGLVFAIASAEPSPSDCARHSKVIDVTLSHVDDRKMTASIWLPDVPGSFPAIVFSHGAFSSPAKYDSLLASWADAGYIVLAALHVDSEVLTGGTPPQRDITWQTRIEDLDLLLDQPSELVKALQAENNEIERRNMIAAGHSYGALIAQLFAGARAKPKPEAKPISYIDSRIKGVVALSPPGPLKGVVEESAWDELRLPQLVITGTADVLPGFIDDWELHRWSHDRAKGKPRWLWVGNGVDHYFGNLIGRTERSAEAQRDGFNDAVSTSIDFLSTILPSGKTPSCKPPASPTAVSIFEKK